MPVRAVDQESSLIALEVTEGIAPAAINKRLLSVGFNISEAAEFDEVQPHGLLVPTGTPIRQNWSTFDIGGGSYPDYNALAYLFTMLFGPATVVTPGGATLAREYTWTPGASALAKSTFSARKGTPTINGVAGTAEEANGCTLTDLMLGFSRTSSQTLSGSGYGGAPSYTASIDVNEVQTVTITGTPTGGTFTLTFGGQTTANIAYDAAAGAVQTALQALSTIGASNATVTGGPGPGTPYVVTFVAGLANTNVAAMTASGALLTGGSTPAVAVTTTTPGAPTDIPLIPILASEVDVFLDNTWAGLGTTKLTSDFSAEWSVGGIYSPLWVLNSALASYKESVLQRPDTSLSLELGNDTVSRALVADMRAGTTKFPRIRAMKSANSIEASQAYELRIDSAMAINSAPSAGDVDGASSLPFGGRIVYDAAGSAWTRIFLRNSVASL